MGSEQRNALIAVVLSGLILFGWQYYFSPPKMDSAPVGPVNTDKSNQPIVEKTTEAPVAPIEPMIEDLVVRGSGVAVTFDNYLTVKNIENLQAAFRFEDTIETKSPLKIEFDFGNGFQSVLFTKGAEENSFLNSAHDLKLTTALNDDGVLNFNINSSKNFKYRLVFKTEPKKLENGQEKVFAFYTDELNRFVVGEEESGDKSIKWAGIDFNYHLFATYFDKPQDLLYKTSSNNTLTIFSNKQTTQFNYSVVFVKKEFNYLTGLGHNLNNSVDFGMWGFFAVWILKGLQFFYKFLPNYGVSIILLTLLVRLITFPLQYKSFVSMKKLQIIQPELTKIREKFKDDPTRMQKESMDLFKKSGANPLGGCLPLLLQMPVFFAFYKVLHSAVELVDAPFVLWIHDLSNKDPFYVLPVLMTLSMFLQQKLTPNTITDPVQKKVMMFMPLIFGFIMKDLPSGLSLYIFVSTVFGILQQMMVFNASNKSTPVVV
jgi:YidC/Oxa1 family membrane protein insertase